MSSILISSKESNDLNLSVSVKMQTVVTDKTPLAVRNPYIKKSSNSSSSNNRKRQRSSDGNNVKKAYSLSMEMADSSASALVIAAADKAGMEGIDRAAVDAIILRESGNSKFMQQQRKRDERVNVRIETLRAKLLATKKASTDDDASTLPAWQQRIQNTIDTEEIPGWIQSRANLSMKVVVDMDMFYMACELLSRPDITSTTPACVGGTNMITTSNYAARRYGVRAAMPGFIGRTLVSELSQGREKLVFCSVNFPLYQAKSAVVKTVLRQYDPNLSAYSLDEAYMDMSVYLLYKLTHPSWTHECIRDYIISQQQQKQQKNSKEKDSTSSPLKKAENMWEEETNHNRTCTKTPVMGDIIVDNQLANNDRGNSASTTKSDAALPEEATITMSIIKSDEALAYLVLNYSEEVCMQTLDAILIDMRQRVCHETGGLTCSAGAGPNFLVAKIASDRNKPDGQLLIRSDHDSVLNFLHPLPTRKVSGIGRVTDKILKAFHIQTVQHLYQNRALVRFLFEESSTANFLLRASVGCSSSDDATDTSEDDAIGNQSPSQQQKGISRERSFQPGMTWTAINIKLEEVAYLLSKDMQRKDLFANTISIKAKLDSYDAVSRARTMSKGVYVQSGSDLSRIAAELLVEAREKVTKSAEYKNCGGFSVRLLGIRCTGFRQDGDDNSPSSNQLTMDRFVQKPDDRHEKLASIDLEKEKTSSIKTIKTPTTNPYSRSPIRNKQSCTKQSPQRSSNYQRKTSELNPSTSSANVTPVKSPPGILLLVCPVCNTTQVHGSSIEIVNNKLNRHIDTCLSGKMVRQVAQEESSRKQHSVPAVADFFGKRKRRLNRLD